MSLHFAAKPNKVKLNSSPVIVHLLYVLSLCICKCLFDETAFFIIKNVNTKYKLSSSTTNSLIIYTNCKSYVSKNILNEIILQKLLKESVDQSFYQNRTVAKKWRKIAFFIVTSHDILGWEMVHFDVYFQCLVYFSQER